MKANFYLVPLFILLSACATTEKNLVGADSDLHGCKGSAGYSWSVLLKECVRPFEKGIPFSNEDHTLNAYVILSENGSQAEIFAPVETTESESILFRSPKVLFSNKSGTITIFSENDFYVLNCQNQKFSTPRTADLDSLFIK
jgi:hypothetical protein